MSLSTRKHLAKSRPTLFAARLVATLLVFLGGSTEAGAAGTEFQVSTSINDQKSPTVGVASDGSFVVVWEDKVALDILARRYDASCNPLGAAFPVNTSINDQKKPSVGVAPDGSFVVVWEDKTTLSILARRFDAAGNPLGAVFQVNTSVNDQKKPSIGVASDGSFVIVWEDKTALDILARRYDASGNPLGAVFQVNTSVNDQKKPSLGVALNGSFVIAWEDTTALDILARRYDASGNPLGAVFQVNTSVNDQQAPSIGVAPDGSFVIAWEDQSGQSILARRYDALGNALGAVFQISASLNNNLKGPSIGVTSGGSFVVAWEDADAAEVVIDIKAREFDGLGNPTGSEFVVNTTTIGDQTKPHLSMNAAGDYVVVWEDKNTLNIYGLATSTNLATLGNLTALWKFDETTGTNAADSSTLSLDGTYTNGVTLNAGGPYPGTGAIAANFDGLDDFVSFPNINANFAQGFSAAFWFKPTTAPSTSTGLLGISNGLDVDEIWIGWVKGTGMELYFSDTTNGSAVLKLDDNLEPTLGRWQHFVASVDTSGNAKIYRDGVQIASGFVSLPSNVNRTQNSIGVTVRNDNFSGAIDDIRVYNRPLSATEVADLYGLVGHWKMDEGTGVTAADATTYSNNATISGATWSPNCAGKNALAFDGISNTAATNVAFTPPATGAVAFWMKASGTPTVRQRLFGVNDNWEARLETTGKISFDLGASPYVGNEPFATGVVDVLDRWYHIVAEFKESDDSYAVYVDGTLQASGTSPVNLVTQSAGILSFGTRTGNSEYWPGSLQDFRVYNRWLSNDEISKFSGFIAHWNLEETSGTVAVDSSVAGNDASYVGAPLLGVAGPFLTQTGFAVDLNGANHSITAAKSLLNNLSEFTLAAWIRPDSVSPSISLLGQYNLIQLGIGSQTNQIDFWTSSGGSINAAGYLPVGKWTHLAAVGNGTGLKLYINGVEVISGGTSTTNYGSNFNFFKVGEGVLNATGDYFDGRIDDIRVNSRALCPDEVRAIYKGGRPAGIRILKWVEVR